MLDETEHCNQLHESYVQLQQQMFVGRTKLKKECMKLLAEMSSGVIAVHGKPGSGKSALMVSYSIFIFC